MKPTSPIRSSRAPALVRALGLGVALLASACSRELPSDWPNDSAASSEAPAGPTRDVTLALDSDPPLPGEPAEGWIGLEQPTTTKSEPGHHGHHGHHDQQAEPDPEPKAKTHDH